MSGLSWMQSTGPNVGFVVEWVTKKGATRQRKDGKMAGTDSVSNVAEAVTEVFNP